MFPEPVSITGFALGAIGFLVMIRNAAGMVLSDSDAIRSHGEALVELRCRIEVFKEVLEIWRRFWQIADGTPDSLFVAYWGSDGSEKLRQLLAIIHRRVRKIGKEFKYKYGDIHDRIYQQVSTPSARPPTYAQAEEELSVQELIRNFKQRTSRMSRWNTALFTGTSFLKHLTSLEQHIDTLKDYSRTCFIAHHLNHREADWEDHVPLIAARTHLTHLAHSSAAVSEALRDTCIASLDHRIPVDFHLDHSIEPDRRLEFLSRCDGKGALIYHLSSSPQENTSGTVLCVSCEEVRDVTGLEWEERSSIFSQAVLRLMIPTTGNGGHVYLKGDGHEATFMLQGSANILQNAESLRSFLVRKQSNFGEWLEGSFLKKEKSRLLYEIAECALLFLKTRWLCELCSCSVYRVEDEEYRPSYLLRINDVCHTPVDGHPADYNGLQWCQQELRGMHIRRLGVLLTEIVLDSTVMDAVYNRRADDVEIDLELNAENPEMTPAYHIRDILRRIQQKGSEDLKDAIGYCLRQGTPAEGITLAQIESFFDHVVAP
jgi:hypothetical protein